MHPIKPSQPINELEQYVVLVPGRYQSSEHIAVVRDEGVGLQIVGRLDSGHLPVYYGSNAVGTVCNARAGLTVRGNLLLRGQKIRPEDYLAIWRATKPVSIDNLASFYGVKLKARFELDLAAESAKKWDYITRETNGPQSFQDYCIAYGFGTSGHEEVLIDSVQAFVDLATFRENSARANDGNYEPFSRIHLVAEDCKESPSVAISSKPLSLQLSLV